MSDERLILNQMMGTLTMAIGILRTNIKFSLEPEQAQIAEIIVRTLESQLKTAKRILEDSSAVSEELEAHRAHAIRAVADVDWITIPSHARTVPVDGGAYVEALIHVSDDDVNLDQKEE